MVPIRFSLSIAGSPLCSSTSYCACGSSKCRRATDAPPPSCRDVLTERRIEVARSEMAATAPLSCVVCMAQPRDTFLNCGHLICRWGGKLHSRAGLVVGICRWSEGLRAGACAGLLLLQAPLYKRLCTRAPCRNPPPAWRYAGRAASAWRHARCAERRSPLGRALLFELLSIRTKLHVI